MEEAVEYESNGNYKNGICYKREFLPVGLPDNKVLVV